MNFYLIGYSGHAFVTLESALSSGHTVLGYFEMEEKQLNPYQLNYLGKEERVLTDAFYKDAALFVGIGNNQARASVFSKLGPNNYLTIIDPGASISRTATLAQGSYIGKSVCINALSKIGTGAIINTGAIVEHECEVGDFAHIAPGAVLCGNVKVGRNSFIGANSVIKQGVAIGDNVTIGAGSVVLRNILNNTVTYGNPVKKI